MVATATVAAIAAIAIIVGAVRFIGWRVLFVLRVIVRHIVSRMA